MEKIDFNNGYVLKIMQDEDPTSCLECVIEKMNMILNKIKKIPLIGRFLNEQFGFESTTA